MPDLCPSVWNLLHDATIVGIAGKVPGTLRLEIEADYLRNRFVESGDRFILALQGCRRFAFRPWNTEHELVTEIAEIGSKRLWILSADLAEECCIVHCSGPPPASEGGGTLEIATEAAVLALDTGRQVSFEELAAVSETYWTEWESSKPSADS